MLQRLRERSFLELFFWMLFWEAEARVEAARLPVVHVAEEAMFFQATVHPAVHARDAEDDPSASFLLNFNLFQKNQIPPTTARGLGQGGV